MFASEVAEPMSDRYLREFVGGPWDGEWGFVPGDRCEILLEPIGVLTGAIPMPDEYPLRVGSYRLVAWVTGSEFAQVWQWKGER